MGGSDVRVKVIRVVKKGSHASAVTLRFMLRATLGMQQVPLKDKMPRQKQTRSTPV